MKRKKMTFTAGMVIFFGLLVICGGSESEAQTNQIMDLSNHKIQDLVRSSGIIASKPLPVIATIVGSPEPRENIAERAIVYLKLEPGTQVKPGDEFTIARWGREVMHPVTGKKIGNAVRVPGVVVILDNQGEIVPARVQKSFSSIFYGDLILPPIPIPPTAMPLRFAENITGTIVAAAEQEENISERVAVFIDRGTRDGVIKGDLFSIYEEPYLTKEGEKSKGPFPLFKVGEGVVISVNTETSTLLITKSFQTIYVGDTVLSGRGR